MDGSEGSAVRGGQPEVVVTGVGVAWGDCADSASFWRRLHDPSGSTDLLEDVGGVRVLRVREAGASLEYRERRRNSLTCQLALEAAVRAVADAGVHPPDVERAAVVVGVAANGTIDHALAAMAPTPLDVDPLLCSKATGSEAASAVARHLGWKGPAWGVGTACSAGNDAIGFGVDLLRTGRADVVVVGGADATCTPPAARSVVVLGVAAADGRCTPFAAGHHGFVVAEGAACLVLERADALVGRTPLVGVAGWASTCDAYHPVAPDPSGHMAEVAIRRALGEAGLGPEDVGLYSAHGTGTPANDRVEIDLHGRLFPSARVMATKGVLGHPYGASPALEGVALTLAVGHRSIPPIWGLQNPLAGARPPAFSPDGGRWEPSPAVSVSFGLGGVNTAVVFTPVAPSRDLR